MIHRKCSLTLIKGVLVADLLLVGLSPNAYARPTTSARQLFSGKVTLQLPATAGAPKKINSKAYQVSPKSSDRKFVIYVTREALLKDEVSKSNKQLSSSIRAMLEAQGYEVLKLSGSGDVFTADFRTYTDVPWQRVGTSAVRGMARFTRTRSKELIGTILMCDPRQWTDSSTGDFKRVVTGARVAK